MLFAHPLAKIKQAGERTTLVARSNNRIHRSLACAFDGTQGIADFFARFWLKAIERMVDGGRQKLNAIAAADGIIVKHLQLVGVVQF